MTMAKLLVALLCSAASAQTFTAQPECDFGTGFDLLDGCNKASALAAPVLPCKDDSDPGPCIESKDVTMETDYMRKVETSEDHDDLLNTAVSAEGGGFGVHVSTSMKYMQESGSTEKSVSYFLGQSGVVRSDRIRGVMNLKASQPALELLKQCVSASNCSFIERYGIHYIDQVTFGRSWLSSFTLWDKKTSKSSSLDVMASFSVNALFVSASASAEFGKKYSDHEESLKLVALGKWSGGSGIAPDFSSPEAMYRSYLQWNQSSYQAPVPLTMKPRNWIDLLEIQEIINGKSDEVRLLFSPGKVVDATTEKITMEHGQTNYVLSAVRHAMAWSCSKELSPFYDVLLTLERNLTTHLTYIQAMNEAAVIARQAEILAGDYSFFYAKAKISEYTAAVNKYFPNGFCGVCIDEYKCGQTGCCSDPDYSVCCPSFPGQTSMDVCGKTGGTCCTDRYTCKEGTHCYVNKESGDSEINVVCCEAGEVGCPSLDGSADCCDSDYPHCCFLQGAGIGCCGKDYPYCGHDNKCYNSEQQMLQGSNGVDRWHRPATYHRNAGKIPVLHNKTSKKIAMAFV